MASPRAAVVRHATEALLLRRTPYGESDLILLLFTEQLGKVSAIARGARKSQKRFGGSLEPFHTLQLRLSERVGAELLTLEEATLSVPRVALVSDRERMDVGGVLLRWVRAAAPARTREPGVWWVLTHALEQLSALDSAPPSVVAARAGLRLLAQFGWALELQACAICGRACPPNKAATISARRGGVICQACGGSPLTLSAELRGRLVAIGGGVEEPLNEEEAELVLRLVQDALRVHADLE